MKILIIGNGAREHALAWKIAQNPKIEDIYVAPGNAGTADIATNLDVPSTDIEELAGKAAKIGVDLTIDVKEYTVWMSMCLRKTHEEMIIFNDTPQSCYLLTRLYKGAGYNCSMVDDQRINDLHTSIMAAGFDEAAKRQLMKDNIPYMIDQCYFIQLPAFQSYVLWQPWVKSYNGELHIGFADGFLNFTKYVWVDQEMKEERTGRK